MSRHLPWTGFVLLLAGCLSAPLPVWFEGLDKPRFTRVNLRSTDAVHLRSSNVLEHPDLIPAGSPVERIEITSRWMQLEINKTRCTMYPVGGTF
ncbi:MAG: hypothetical protein JXA90_12670, partial [Planctomycetes bacterium]|nr:hypothetical protein [Planctomycetota bacterium]